MPGLDQCKSQKCYSGSRRDAIDRTSSTVTFEEEDSKTLLVMHELYPSKEALDGAIDGMEGGMPEAFAQLDELLLTLGASAETVVRQTCARRRRLWTSARVDCGPARRRARSAGVAAVARAS
jgi:hypothetical protein